MINKTVKVCVYILAVVLFIALPIVLRFIVDSRQTQNNGGPSVVPGMPDRRYPKQISKPFPTDNILPPVKRDIGIQQEQLLRLLDLIL